jgi:hypothetical protein
MTQLSKLSSVLAAFMVVSLAACSGHSTGQVLPGTNPDAMPAPGAQSPAIGAGLRFHPDAPGGAIDDVDSPDKAAASNVAIKLGGTSISVGSKSVVVTLTKQGSKAVKPPKKTVTNIGAAKGDVKCTTAKGCTVPGPAAKAGSDTFTVQVYDTAGGKGHVLAVGTVVGKIKAKKTTVPANLKKNVATAVVGSTSGVPGTAKAATALSLTIKDADGNAVVGTFNNPVTVTDSDTSTATALAGSKSTGTSKSRVYAASGGTLTISYTGKLITSAKLTPSGSGVVGTAGSFTVNPSSVTGVISPAPTVANEIDLYATSGTGSSATLTVGQLGWSGSFGGTFSYAVAGANCTSYTITPASGTAATVYTVVAKSTAAAGKCTMTVTGGVAKTLPITLTFTTTGIGINGKHQ